MTSGLIDLHATASRMARRDVARSEADVQSGVREFLLHGGLNLGEGNLEEVHLESALGDGRRIDVEIGSTVIEVKKDLRGSGSKVAEWEAQLAGYVAYRSSQEARRYVGILTDGCEWRLYYLEPAGTVRCVDSHRVDTRDPDVDALRTWLEAVLATSEHVTAAPSEIARRLGVNSPGFALDRATLASLWEHAKKSSAEARLKRELWKKLLRTAYGQHFEDSDELFVEHTYLVLTAEVIAHAVLNEPVEHLSASQIVSGERFVEAGVTGVVEADFFDWVLDADGGASFVKQLGRRLSRFEWASVDHDALKHLYESVISESERHQLGEYYTPDWLADAVVQSVVDDPLAQRVLDPACGSGTFLFHAIRKYLAAADAAGLPNREALSGLTDQVYGVDVHPVAVTLARVTYLLAIGPQRLNSDRGSFGVPVYLGDSLQWQHDPDTLGGEGLRVSTEEAGGVLFGEEVLVFPEELLADPGSFDALVTALANRATRRERGSTVPPIKALLKRQGVAEAHHAVLTETFQKLCSLHDSHRNHIWSYYVRNLARPLWLARAEGKVDRLVGNPPWLSFRFMTPVMQRIFKERSEERNLWHGRGVATHQDLSGYFVARAAELYLGDNGRFGFVMPAATTSRKAFAGFRKGDYGTTRVAFSETWNLDAVRPHLFPVPSCVVMGSAAARSQAMPTAEAWTGTLPPSARAAWHDAAPHLTRAAPGSGAGTQDLAAMPLSPYHSMFTQGATIVPRVLHFVKRATSTGGLGLASGVSRVQSSRSGLEKPPWKHLPDRGPTTVESAFLYPLHLGATVLPYRLREPEEIVLPWDGGRLLSGSDGRLDAHPLLADWWRQAESSWNKLRPASSKLALVDRIDYQRTLTAQLPPRPVRVVYTAAGVALAAAVLSDSEALVNSDLYWAEVSSLGEAHYLVGVLNSPVTTQRVQPLQSRGLFGPRHFHKYVWLLPIPAFDSANTDHRKISALSREAEIEAATVLSSDQAGFQQARKKVREHLTSLGLTVRIDELVARLLAP